MCLDYAIKILTDELNEQKDWYGDWKTTTTKGSSLPGKEEQIKGLEKAIQLLIWEKKK